jgi:hypothetical protein
MRQELCLLIQRRNELAKLAKTEKVALPPVLNNKECTNCYVSRICSLQSISLEVQRQKPDEYFDTYKEIY